MAPNQTRHGILHSEHSPPPPAKETRTSRRPAMARKRCGRTSQKVGMPPTDGAGFAAGSGLARQAPLNQIDSPQTPAEVQPLPLERLSTRGGVLWATSRAPITSAIATRGLFMAWHRMTGSSTLVYYGCSTVGLHTVSVPTNYTLSSHI